MHTILTLAQQSAHIYLHTILIHSAHIHWQTILTISTTLCTYIYLYTIITISTTLCTYIFSHHTNNLFYTYINANHTNSFYTFIFEHHTKNKYNILHTYICTPYQQLAHHSTHIFAHQTSILHTILIFCTTSCTNMFAL